VAIAFGVLAQKAGISERNTVLLSLLVYAGSSQLIAVGLFSAGAPPLSIILTTFVVNLRHLLMSASLAPYLSGWRKLPLAAFAFQLTDETFALHSARFPQGVPPKAEVFGVHVTAQVAWVLGTWLGFHAGELVPEVEPLGLDYALPAMFLALLMVIVRERKQLITALIAGFFSVVLALAGVDRWNVILGALLAATVGVGVDTWIKIRSS
jgi:4-azaleucine resistance transporter AzlC